MHTLHTPPALLHLSNTRYRAAVQRHFENALADDGAFRDITSKLLFKPREKVKAYVYAKQAGVVAGLEEASYLLRKAKSTFHFKKKDGEKISLGEHLVEIELGARIVFGIERTLLNLLGRMSGVATKTAHCVAIARKINPNILIVPTRKTLWGRLDKKACLLGGGGTHRLSLDDAVLIKHPHIKASSLSLENVLIKTFKSAKGRFIEVEVGCKKDAFVVSQFYSQHCKALSVPFIVMLDNLEPAACREIIQSARKNFKPSPLFEVSGGITQERLAGYAKTGADIISMGELTTAVTLLDLALRIGACVHNRKNPTLMVSHVLKEKRAEA